MQVFWDSTACPLNEPLGKMKRRLSASQHCDLLADVLSCQAGITGRDYHLHVYFPSTPAASDMQKQIQERCGKSVTVELSSNPGSLLVERMDAFIEASDSWRVDDIIVLISGKLSCLETVRKASSRGLQVLQIKSQTSTHHAWKEALENEVLNWHCFWDKFLHK
ncbi:hypothetical protein DUNSADRAFT_9070 [Dunaliella salina]|uniref:NYN domain-containing protein n=1 Tax=Dunaliella salina TaxID=3046 RepID=A0ABQ7H5J5_DUNSA|nr:hypothetical protein DUNSADRAFT_9070 [Dunaliella salina]|eukprot:KAF5842111.1 hypothetical protein DUNSADRAFT_9070 [Dunaliella salina]